MCGSASRFSVSTPELSAAGYPWTEFRDVVAVDGQPVSDRQEQLSQLLVKRHTLPLILHPVNEHRFAFSRMGEETVDDLRVWKVGLQERVSPTLIRNGTQDCTAVGTFWIAPGTGDVIQADLECRDASRSSTRMTVKYRAWERGPLRLPAEMVEQPPDTGVGRGTIAVQGKCQYSNHRRFETGARLILPPRWP
jgi:hypothetical protein